MRNVPCLLQEDPSGQASVLLLLQTASKQPTMWWLRVRWTSGLLLWVLSLYCVLGLLHSDPVRKPFADTYLPGHVKPSSGCFASVYDPSQWTCKIGDVIVGGYDSVIRGTTFLFTGVRLGDVYAVLGRPMHVTQLASGIWRMEWSRAFLYAQSANPSKPVYNLTLWS